jgi:hypothetical protein
VCQGPRALPWAGMSRAVGAYPFQGTDTVFCPTRAVDQRLASPSAKGAPHISPGHRPGGHTDRAEEPAVCQGPRALPWAGMSRAVGAYPFQGTDTVFCPTRAVDQRLASPSAKGAPHISPGHRPGGHTDGAEEPAVCQGPRALPWAGMSRAVGAYHFQGTDTVFCPTRAADQRPASPSAKGAPHISPGHRPGGHTDRAEEPAVCQGPRALPWAGMSRALGASGDRARPHFPMAHPSGFFLLPLDPERSPSYNSTIVEMRNPWKTCAADSRPWPTPTA